MKTLILNGSPRKNGDTVSLIKVLTESLSGEYRIVSCYYEDISPCTDCRHCRTEKKCIISDGMQEIYRYIEECDNVVIASPMYFSEITGRLLDTASRLQMYFSARFFRQEDTGIKPKRGGVILTGGGDGDPEKAFSTARTVLHHMNAYDIFPMICSHNTNCVPATEDSNAVAAVKMLTEFLNNKR